MSMLLDDYINGEQSVCREKRQYTAMLYGVLSGTSKVKLDLETYENKNYEVFRAYYEPAFLRDYFDVAEDKRAFNVRLVEFANKKLKEIIKLAGKKRGRVNPPGVRAELITIEKTAELGGTEDIYNLSLNVKDAGEEADLAKHLNGWGKAERIYRNPVARWMVNVKPDIALLLRRKGVKRGEYRLHFVDMEYLAGPETYPALVAYYDKEGVAIEECYRVNLTKQALCDYVLEFLCEELSVKGMQEEETACEAGFTSVSAFVSEKKKDVEGVSLDKLCEHARKMYIGEKVKESKLLLGKNMVLSI